VLSVDDPASAAHDFNWLLMGQPVNQAMMLGSSSTPGARQLRTHARRAVTVFLAAYDHGR
jgi:TetR/AcrR family transcriptional repressor of mexJK operon